MKGVETDAKMGMRIAQFGSSFGISDAQFWKNSLNRLRSADE
jgi:hypothetical protein